MTTYMRLNPYDDITICYYGFAGYSQDENDELQRDPIMLGNTQAELRRTLDKKQKELLHFQRLNGAVERYGPDAVLTAWQHHIDPDFDLFVGEETVSQVTDLDREILIAMGAIQADPSSEPSA